MTQAVAHRKARRDRGYSLVELVIVMLIGTVLTAMAIPQVKSQVYSYRLNSAVAMAKWAIQSTRFQALREGYPFQVAFTASSQTYQIQDLPSGTTYQNVGGVVPLAAWPMTFSADTTINFKPNGMVTATVGSNSFTITYQGTTKTITVSNYGNVKVQ
ncbi:MAG TPA: GspH/FimT family pseudopilin [Candidatus Acidoferrales bacterium]|nr:GspH/FimT family pseudopilin [Candidatus Acidoferrales bacterium]